VLVDEHDADVVARREIVERGLYCRDGRVALDDEEVRLVRRPVADARQQKPRDRVLVPCAREDRRGSRRGARVAGAHRG
jgi:hypothetical protein